MAGFLNGKYAGFLSEEIFSEDVNIEAVDGDLLAEELEQAQEELFIEQEKFNTATEAECETTETVAEIEAALESGTNDVVYAKLLVNKLIKYNTVFYGTSKQLSSGLESEKGSDAKSILQAGLEDGKGMIDAIKEFIAKVWQKIKDAFAWVWKKMKDFWNWLTGANKKTKEKLEVTVVSASALSVAIDKSGDIKKAADDVTKTFEQNAKEVGDKLDKLQEELVKFTSYGVTELLNKSQSNNFDDIDFDKMTQEEFNAWCMANPVNKEKVKEAVIGNIIIEAVAIETGIDEKKVNKLAPASLIKAVSLFAYDPKLQSNIAKTLNSNFSGSGDIVNSTIAANIAKLAFFEMSHNVNSSFQGTFKYTPASIREDYAKFEKDYSLLDRVLGNMGSDAMASDYIEQIISRMLKNGYLHTEGSDYLDGIYVSVEQLSTLIDSLKNGIVSDWNTSYTADNQLEIKNFVPLIPLSFTGESVIFINAITMYKVSTSDIPNFSFNKFKDNIKKYKFTDKIVSDITKIKIKDDAKYLSEQQKQANRLKQSLDELVSIADKALDGIEKAYERNMKDADARKKKDWNNIKNAILMLVSHSKTFSPSIVIEQAKINNDSLNLILDLIDLPRTIAQAAKELK